MPYERIKQQVENPFASLIPDQQIAIVPSFKLESGVVIHNVPVAYSTRGRLSKQGDNAMVICHALSGSADVGDWWGPLLGGSGKAFDLSRFFVVCVNCLGSPYGTASPMTYKDGDPAQGRYGPEFPLTTIRDDVALSKLLLDDMGVKRIAAVVGGSMGGMSVLEFAYLGKEYVKVIVPIATSARHSAWCISWGEAQRQSIYSDPKYEDGYYSLKDPPATGLGAARMSALLTYRSRDSFESRFGRNLHPLRKPTITSGAPKASAVLDVSNEHFDIHNEGHRNAGMPRSSHPNATSPQHLVGGEHDQYVSCHSGSQTRPSEIITIRDPEVHGATPIQTRVPVTVGKRATTYFSAQSYLRYQGDKFIKRFDANCYIAITRKLDTHDLSFHCTDHSSVNALQDALALIKQPALVLGIKSDGLFTFAEQQGIARGISNATLKNIDSPEGHDAFLLQFEQVNKYILDFFLEELPEVFSREPSMAVEAEDNLIAKNSTFGEAEVEDITAW